MKKILTAIVIIATVLALVACVPSRDACKAKYENAGYSTVPLSANTLELSGEDVDFIYCGSREDSGDYIRIVAFKKKDKATEYAERANVEENEGSGYLVVQKSKVVLVGTQNAIDIYNNKGGLVEGSESDGGQEEPQQ